MKDLLSSILTILRYGGRAITIFRNIIINSIFLFLFLIICLSFFMKDETLIQDNSALLLNLSGNIVEERRHADPFGEMLNESLGFKSLPEETLLQDVLDAIAKAADDSRIKTIVLDLKNLGRISLDQIKDIGGELSQFKLAGKQVIAAEDYYTQSKYLLASYANKVFLNPEGIVDLHGMGAYQLYFKDAIDKLKINYHVFRVGTYKSATEPYTRNSMSEEAKTQNSKWLDSLWNNYLAEIEKQRGIDRSTLDSYTNDIASLLREHNGDPAKLALNIELIDDLKSRHELLDFLVDLTDESRSRGFRHVTLKEYLKNVTPSYIDDGSDKPKVGLIVAQGNILPGDQPPGTIGSDTLLGLIRKAKEDDNIKAVVLRLDTGGGSVFASEMIRDELEDLREKGKPLVISMGSLAASGGYWISAQADEIWAYPTTLTGSIGIFGAIPTFEDSLANLGIYSDGVGTTNLAAGLNLLQPLKQEVKNAIQLNVEHGYDQFLQIVSDGRQLALNDLAKIAEGRVFDGSTAHALGLVDKLGNLEDAIHSAATLASLDEVSAQYIQKKKSLSERVLGQMQITLSSWTTKLGISPSFLAKLSNIDNSFKVLNLFEDPKHIYAHCMINSYK